MDIKEQPTTIINPGLADSPELANSDNNVADEIWQYPVVPSSSPMSTTHITGMRDIHASVSPLGIYGHMAGQSGLLDDGTTPVSAAGDTAATKTAGPADELSQDPPAHRGITVLNAPNEDDEVSQYCMAPEYGSTRDGQLADDDLLDPGSPKSHIETAASDSAIHASPDPEPASSSLKSQQSKKRRKVTVDLDSLPNLEDELNDAEIASLCSQPPRIRQRYTNYFASHGVIRAAYYKILFQRHPNGELRLPEEVLRSCSPKWRERLEAYEAAESSHAGVGHSRKRKGTMAAAKPSADDDTDSHKPSLKKAKKTTPSKSEDLQVDQPISETSPPSRPVPTLRFRPVISCRTAVSMGRPPGIHSSQTTTVSDAGYPENVPVDCLKHPVNSTFDHRHDVTSDSTQVQQAYPDVREINSHRPCLDNRPAQSTSVFNLGRSQLLDPNYLAQFAQNLTGEIQQLDLDVVTIARSLHDEGPYWRFRNLRDTLLYLRDQCVDIETKLRRHLATKEEH
ncbi:hypothetical protein PMG11_05267 [Penicillium brasilianum]|uniref:Uncharacterized protein n=1 Tax=Penicillium brasilianum TaxID=104259 RepID=A0A0F7VHX3_PENBI|nr:hypothetical protein PMG11_05267 [Penicillium brasilianum]